MLKIWGVQEKKAASTMEAKTGERLLDFTAEMLKEPEDRCQPDTSAVFQALKNVETLPQIRALKRMRVQTCAQGDAAVECEDASNAQVLLRLLRSLAFWK